MSNRGNFTCPTRPAGDSTNAQASTEFVTSAIDIYTYAKCDNIATLRQNPVEDGKAFIVGGYYQVGDGASGIFYPSPTVPKAQFTGSIAMTVDAGAGVETVLTVSAVASGTIYIGMKITGASLSTPMYVAQQLTGTYGGVGTYAVRDAMSSPLNLTVASSSMTGTMYWDNGGTVILPTGGDGTRAWLREIAGDINVKWFGTKNLDQTLVGVGFVSLSAAQAVYPFVTSLTQKIDQVAIQAAVLFAQGIYNRQYAVFAPKGRYYTDTPIVVNNLNGVKLRGERTTSLYDGAFIDFSGSDFAFRLRNAKNFDTTAYNVTVTNGSAVVTGVTSWPYLAAGMAVTINKNGWGVIQSVGVNTVTLSVVYTGTSSSTATFEAVYGLGDVYRVEMSDLGIFCTNQTYSGGGIYGRNVDECKFWRINIYGTNTIYPNVTYKTIFGFFLDGFALSSVYQCHVSYVQYGFHIPRVCLESSISECNIFAIEIGINIGDGVFGLNIVRNYMELFENGIRLANNALVGFIDCWNLNILNNGFQRTYGTGNSRALNIQNVDNSSQFRIKFNFHGNYCNMYNFGGPAPANCDYAVQIYMDSANTNSSLYASIKDNVFTYVNAAGVSVNDTGLRPAIIESGNISTTGWNNTFVKNFAYIQSSMAPLSANFTSFRQNTATNAPANTSENVLATFVVPGNVLKADGSFKIKTKWNVTNNANAKTLNIKFTSVAGTVINTLNAASAASATMDAEVSNRNVTNSQFIQRTNMLSSGTLGIANSTAAIDTTVPVTVIVSAQKAVSGDTITLESVLVEISPS